MATPKRLLRRWGWTFDPFAYEARYADPSLGQGPQPPDAAALNAPTYADALPPDSLLANRPTWYTPEQELGWAAGNRGSAPTVDDLAAFWPEQPGQERSLAVAWWQPDTESYVPLTGLGTGPTVDDLAALWPEQPGQEASTARLWYQPEDDTLGGAYPEEVVSEWAPFLGADQPFAYAAQSFALDDDTMPWAAILGAPPFDPTLLPNQLDQELEAPTPWIDPSHVEAAADDPAKPLGPAPTITGVWGPPAGYSPFQSAWQIHFTWPDGLGPDDYAVTYNNTGSGWSQNNDVYPDDYRNPSPAVDRFSTGSGIDFVDVMVRMVRSRPFFADPAFDVDPVMAIGDPVPLEAYGYASAVVRIFVIRPATFAGSDTDIPYPFVVLDPSLLEASVPLVLAPTFDPATLPLVADPELPSATRLVELEGAWVPVPLPNAPVLPQHFDPELPSARWTVDPNLDALVLTGLPNAPTFPLTFDPELPAQGWTVDPHLYAAEGFVPITPPTSPVVLILDPELPLARWTVDPHAYEAYGVPPFAPSFATAAQLAGLWPDASPQQDRSTQPVWIPAEGADGPLELSVLVPPFNPVGVVPITFDHEPPSAVWGVHPEAAMDGGLAAWLFLTWGGCPPVTGSAPPVMVDAENGDPYLYLGGIWIARVD